LTLDQPYTLLSILLLSVIFLLPLAFKQSVAHRIEQKIVGFVERPILSSVTLFLAVIIIRLLLLPRFAIPVPFIHDEFSYLLMGDTFAHERLANPPHPLWLSFETFHVNWNPTYSSIYPPAQGFVLAVGQLLGNPWIGVLLSTASMCVAIFWMLRAWFPTRWAFLGAVMVAAKFGFTHYWMNSYWGGAAAATGGALVLGALPRILRRASVRDALLLGLGIAILANSRPFEGLLFCLPAAYVLLHWLFAGPKDSEDRVGRAKRVLLPLTAMLILTGAFMAFYNWRLTGNALLFPHTLSVRTYHTESFFLWQKPKPPILYNNQEFDRFFNQVLRNAYRPSWSSVWRVLTLKVELLWRAYLWPGAMLLLPIVAIVFFKKKLRLLVAMFAIVIAGYSILVWPYPHYIAPITCIIFAFLVQALRRLQVMVRRRGLGAALARAVVMLLFIETINNVERDVCSPYIPTCEGDVDREVARNILQTIPGKHLVVVRYGAHHNIDDEWVYNGAEIDSAKILWARDISPAQNQKLFTYFSDRQIWIVEPDEADPQARRPKQVPRAAERPPTLP